MIVEYLNSVVTLIVGAVAIYVYKKQKLDTKRDAANSILLEIQHAERSIDKVRDFIKKDSLDVDVIILQADSWIKNKHLFSRDFDKDEWELYHVDVDRAESKNLAKENPEKLKELVKDWFDEAEKNFVLPLDDRNALEFAGAHRPTGQPPRDKYIYYPSDSPVPLAVAVDVVGRSYMIVTDVEITDKDCSGVIFAHGSRFGGHSLFIKDRKLHYVYNFLGIAPEQEFVSQELKPGKYTFGMEFKREKAGPHHESVGSMKLYVNDKVVAEGPMKTQPGKFSLGGDGLCVGWDSGDAVSRAYKVPGKFRGGRIVFVAVTVDKTQYLDIVKEAQAAFERD